MRIFTFFKHILELISIAEKYYTIGTSELHSDISGLNQDGPHIHGFPKVTFNA